MVGVAVLVVGLVKVVSQGDLGFLPAVNSFSLSVITQGKLGYKNDSGFVPKQAEVVLGEADQETEPIVEPINNVQQQANTLIKLIKNVFTPGTPPITRPITRHLPDSYKQTILRFAWPTLAISKKPP